MLSGIGIARALGDRMKAFHINDQDDRQIAVDATRGARQTVIDDIGYLRMAVTEPISAPHDVGDGFDPIGF